MRTHRHIPFLLSAIVVGWITFTSHQAALAQTTGDTITIAPQTPDSITTGLSVTAFLSTLYDHLFAILTLLAGILAVIYLIFQGIRLVTSAGDATRVKSARAGIINALIGVVIITITFLIIRVAGTVGSTLSNL